MEETKKRHFIDNELRKHRISMAQKRKNQELRKAYMNITENGSRENESDGLDIDFYNNEYIRESNQICNLFLKICDIIPTRQMMKKKVEDYYCKSTDDTVKKMLDSSDNDDNKENKQGKRVVITPEQRDRIFSVEGGENNEED